MTSLLHPRARLVDARTGSTLGGAALGDRVARAADAFAELPPGVALIRMPAAVEAVVRYQAAWRAGRPLVLLDPGLARATLRDFVDRLEPAIVVGLDAEPTLDGAPEGYRPLTHPALGMVWRRESPPSVAPHPDLGVLLATSGSTGSPKLVRLSRTGVLVNTASIIEALSIGAHDVAVSSLPFFYSYGMSVLNTHLAAGATVVIEPTGLLHRPFWDAVAEHGVTSLACVPYQFETLRRLPFEPGELPHLRTLTQAGGRLAPEVVRDFHRRMTEVGGRLYIMYGQTEAAPRLTTLPAERLAEKLGSVGPAVPGGRLSVQLDDGTETTAPGASGEVLYRGLNVMMGYAESAADLARGDECGGLLETGDLGYLDDEGYLFLTGRVRRLGKVFGVRLNLDDVEAMLHGHGPVAVVNGDDRIVVFLERADAATLRRRAADLATRLRVHRSGIDVRSTAALPLLSTGKVDYRALERSVRR